MTAASDTAYNLAPVDPITEETGMDRPQKTRQRQPLELAALACAFLVCLNKITDFDYWTHLALGREFVTRRAIHIEEPFLAPMVGKMVDPTEWPFQSLLHLLNDSISHIGISIFVALIATLTLYVMTAQLPGRDDARRIAGLLLLTGAFFAARGRYQPRPEIIVFLLFALTLTITTRWKREPRARHLAALVILFALWRELHLSWSLGAAFALFSMAAEPRPEFWRAHLTDKKRFLLPAAFLTGAAYALVTVTLFAARVFTEIGKTGNFSFIAEWRPLWEWPEGLIPLLAVAIPSLPLAWGAKKGRPYRILFWAGATTLSMLAARNYPLGILLTAHIAIEGLSTIDAERFKLPTPLAKGALAAALIAFIALSATSRRTPWGAGLHRQMELGDTARFFKAANLNGPLFNTYEIGGGLEYHFRGDPRTYIDGSGLGGDEYIAKFRKIVEGPDPNPLLDQVGTRTIIARALFRNSGRILPLVANLMDNPRWKLVNASDALTFIRADGPTPAIPKSAGWEYIAREAELLGETAPDAPHLRYTLGHAEFRLGNFRKADAHFAEGVKNHPKIADWYADEITIAKRMK